MVLTVRPAWASSDGERSNSRTAERLAVRRIALPLFAQQGYEAVTVDDITASAGVSRRTFFRLFGGKHEVASCDHEVYHFALYSHLLQHQSERTLDRAARGAQLVVESLTAVHHDATSRASLIARNPAVAAEESRWYERYQVTIAQFLTDQPHAQSTVEAEMTAASIVAAMRFAVRHHIHDAKVPATTTFTEAMSLLARVQGAPVRRVAIIETSLSAEALFKRLSDS